MAQASRAWGPLWPLLQWPCLGTRGATRCTFANRLNYWERGRPSRTACVPVWDVILSDKRCALPLCSHKLHRQGPEMNSQELPRSNTCKKAFQICPGHCVVARHVASWALFGSSDL